MTQCMMSHVLLGVTIGDDGSIGLVSVLLVTYVEGSNR